MREEASAILAEASVIRLLGHHLTEHAVVILRARIQVLVALEDATTLLVFVKDTEVLNLLKLLFVLLCVQ